MQSLLRILTILLLTLLLGAGPAAAQRRAFHTLTEANGAPSSSFTDAMQDSLGRLWAATRVGVAVYDGHEWRLEAADRGLLRHAVFGLGMDGGGRIWAVTQSLPMLLYRRDEQQWVETRTVAPVVHGPDVTAFAVDPSRSGDETRIAVAARDPVVYLWRADAWRTVSLGFEGSIHSLCWRGDNLYVSSGRGLYAIDCSGPEPGPALPCTGLPPGPVYTVLPGADGSGLTVLARGWLGNWDGATATPLLQTPELVLGSPGTGVAAARDSLGGLWFSDQGSVLHWHPLQGVERLSMRSGLVADGASSILADGDGQVWFFGLRGISVLRDQRLVGLDRSAGLFEDEVTAIHFRDDGTAVLGHEGGLSLVGETTRRVPVTVAGHSRRVMAISPAEGGGEWLAFGRLGLCRLAPDGTVTAPDTLLQQADWVPAVAPAGRDSLWIAHTTGLSLQTSAGRRLVLDRAQPQQSVPSIRRIRNTGSGTFYATTARHGLLHHSGGVTRQFQSPEPGGNSTYETLPRPDGSVWVGTGVGLRRIVSDSLAAMGPGEPRINRPVYAMVEDQAGRVWIGTDGGVQVWDGTSLVALTPADGLIGSEINRDALKVDLRGRVWIGTNRGVSIYDERLGHPRTVAPAARIEGWLVNDAAVPAGQAPDLPAAAHELGVVIRSSSLRGSDRQLFRTWLAGRDHDWSEPRPIPDGVLRFRNLPAGRYRLRVQAVNAAGLGGPEAVSSAFTVPRPLWARPWVLALNGGALMALAWVVASGLAARRHAGSLEAQVRARTAELEASERAVRRESGRLAVVLGSITDAVIVVDSEGRILMDNPAADALVGRAGVRLHGRHLDEVLPGLVELVREAGAAEVAGPSSFLGPGGALHYRVAPAGPDLDVSVARIEQPGAAGGSRVLVLRDVTGRRRSEDERLLRRRLDTLSGLATGLAREIEAMAATMQDAADALRGGPAAADGRPAVDRLGTAADEARALSDRLAALARTDLPTTAPVDVAALLRRVTSGVGPAVEAVLDLAPDLKFVRGDARQLAEALQAIVTNGCRAMPRGGRLTVTARNIAGPLDPLAVEILIGDEGPGIAAADAERIFEPYYTTHHGAAGLGLAVAQAVITRHAGRVTLQSVPGKGATFIVSLPAVGAPGDLSDDGRG